MAKALINFDPSQRRFFDDESRVQVVIWHRQKGKDFVAAAKAVSSAMRTGQDWFIVSLTQRQADATFAKCKQFAEAYKRGLKVAGRLQYDERAFLDRDREIDQAFDCRSREIVLPNGARVVSLPGRDPDTLAGLTGNVIFTEFGLFPKGGYDHWRVVFPLTTRGHQVLVISTPRGRNTKLYEMSLDEAYSRHFCDIVKSVEQDGFALKDNKGEPCTLDQFRRLYNDEPGWAREYMCEFAGDLESLVKWAQLEEAAALGEGLDFRMVRINNDAAWDRGFFVNNFPAGARLEVGWDVARKGHLSAITVNLRRGQLPRHLWRVVLMRNCTFAHMRELVCAAMEAGRGSVGAGDATGLGMESNEVLARRYRHRWEPVQFTAASKRDLASQLATGFGDRQQTLPALVGDTKAIATDVYAVQRDETGGTLHLIETENPLLPESHCDIAYSLALARLAGSRATTEPLPAPLMRKPVWA